MSRLDAAYRVTERLWWGISARGIVAVIAILTVVRIWVANHTGMLWDEPYYWLWSEHLSAGYLDHPPMVAFWIRAGTGVLGDSVLGIRIAFIVTQILVSLAVYGIGRALFDRRIAELGALWTNVTPLIGIAGMMATPDGPSVFFWTLTILAYALVVRTERGAWWLLVGLCAGLGGASKYTNFFVGPGLLLSLIVDRDLRRWLVSPWLWAGLVVAFIVFFPVIQWNSGHDWASFRFQFGRIGEDSFDPADFFGLLIFQPLIFSPYASLFLGLGVRDWLAQRQKYGRAIGILCTTTLPAMAFILFQATHGAVLQHWLAPIYPTLALIAVAGASTLGGDNRILRRLRTDAVPFAIAAALVVFAYVTTPADRFFPGKDPINSMRGWPDYATKVEALRERTGAAWIATAGYEVTSELAFELRDKAVVVPITERARYSFAPPPDPALLDKSALIIIHPAASGTAALGKCFATVTPLGDVERFGAVQTLDTDRAFLATGAATNLFTDGCADLYSHPP